LSGQDPSEADIAATRIGQSTAPIGATRPVATVPLPGSTVDGAVIAPAGGIALPAAAAGIAPPAASAPQRVALEKRR
jgi:penicillin-binding protein 2